MKATLICITNMIVLLFLNTSFAKMPTCPSDFQVKKVKLIEAIQHSLDADVWNFASTVITNKGTRWNIWFGSFFPNIKTPQEALRKGQAYFDTSSLMIKNPHPYRGLPSYIFCDYMPPGSAFWVSAVSPPAYGKVP